MNANIVYSLICGGMLGCLGGCASHPVVRNNTNVPIDDFGITKDKKDPNLINETDAKSEADEGLNQRLVQSSLPLPVQVGRGRGSFNNVPRGAGYGAPSLVKVRWNRCFMDLATSTIQVDRYLGVAGGHFIKMKEGLAPNVTLPLERGMDFYFKIATRVMLVIPTVYYNECRRELMGKKVYLGLYHVNHTSVQMLGSPGSPGAMVQHTPAEVGGEKLFLKWDVKSSSPILVDQFDLPVYIETDVYRMSAQQDGSYYMQITPQLKPINTHVKFAH